MQEKHLYEYAMIRVVPVLEREEFLNVGVAVFSKRAKFIKVLWTINESKIALLSDELDIDQIRLNLQSFEKVALGDKECGPIAKLDITERFRWLTSTRSSALQVSKTHAGLSDDLEKTAQRLFENLVL
ncbi:DUF3037 family protein [Roseivirga ehrenbergii]|uniref:DUF3037 domain-containing protein n=2 Tax=Roseivirga TaxID=290180 RepID=A0A150X9M1_9BACT|nr:MULTISPECIES: DUF3037 domain-containing protein [Roseivirga]KYG72161.1 hypothetical protein MB14_08925 [Roseivirga ehrenbergii]KYG75386.1 hypothetical protein AWN68_07500 [Roseivirga echinicomitans]TCL13394.1 DUF3037 family protein [Roseivirga ehrenbergii]